MKERKKITMENKRLSEKNQTTVKRAGKDDTNEIYVEKKWEKMVRKNL